jgi:hypothetical protein
MSAVTVHRSSSNVVIPTSSSHGGINRAPPTPTATMTTATKTTSAPTTMPTATVKANNNNSVTSGNPLQDDPELRRLLQELESIDSQKSFRTWRGRFERALEPYVATEYRQAAQERYQAFAGRMSHLSGAVKKLFVHLQQGNVRVGGVTVRARQTLSDLQAQVSAAMDAMTDMLPATLEQEKKMGYTKFHLGAVLVRDGFCEYDRLVICDEIMQHLREHGLQDVADKQILAAMSDFHDRLEMFCHVMADLGLYKAMLKCRELLKLEEEEDAAEEEDEESLGTEELLAVAETETDASPAPKVWEAGNSSFNKFNHYYHGAAPSSDRKVSATLKKKDEEIVAVRKDKKLPETTPSDPPPTQEPHKPSTYPSGNMRPSIVRRGHSMDLELSDQEPPPMPTILQHEFMKATKENTVMEELGMESAHASTHDAHASSGQQPPPRNQTRQSRNDDDSDSSGSNWTYETQDESVVTKDWASVLGPRCRDGAPRAFRGMSDKTVRSDDGSVQPNVSLLTNGVENQEEDSQDDPLLLLANGTADDVPNGKGMPSESAKNGIWSRLKDPINAPKGKDLSSKTESNGHSSQYNYLATPTGLNVTPGPAPSTSSPLGFTRENRSFAVASVRAPAPAKSRPQASESEKTGSSGQHDFLPTPTGFNGTPESPYPTESRQLFDTQATAAPVTSSTKRMEAPETGVAPNDASDEGSLATSASSTAPKTDNGALPMIAASRSKDQDKSDTTADVNGKGRPAAVAKTTTKGRGGVAGLFTRVTKKKDTQASASDTSPNAEKPVPAAPATISGKGKGGLASLFTRRTKGQDIKATAPASEPPKATAAVATDTSTTTNQAIESNDAASVVSGSSHSHESDTIESGAADKGRGPSLFDTAGNSVALAQSPTTSPKAKVMTRARQTPTSQTKGVHASPIPQLPSAPVSPLSSKAPQTPPRTNKAMRESQTPTTNNRKSAHSPISQLPKAPISPVPSKVPPISSKVDENGSKSLKSPPNSPRVKRAPVKPESPTRRNNTTSAPSSKATPEVQEGQPDVLTTSPQTSSGMPFEQGEAFGYSVSVSSNGTILASGSPQHGKNSKGRARVVCWDSEENGWTQMGQDLMGKHDGDTFGTAVALDASGHIVAVGSPQLGTDKAGYVRVYRYHQDDNYWAAMGPTIEGKDLSECFGWSVSLSSDGHRLVVGGPKSQNQDGVVRMYQFGGAAGRDTWKQCGGDIRGSALGASVATSTKGELAASGRAAQKGIAGNFRAFKVQQ